AHSRTLTCPTPRRLGCAQSGAKDAAVVAGSASTVMKYSLRKTPSHLHLAYKYGEASDGLLGRNFTLQIEGHELTLSIDLTPNFHTRSKTAAAYLDAVTLTQNHHKLKFLQCSDNLVRTRLVRAWEQIDKPRLRMCLELGPRRRYLYDVQPHSLFAGGIQFDVQRVIDETSSAEANSRALEHHGHGHSA
ncbi:MAG: hypothetical protein ACXWJM_04810, partial [Ramlibacter sp.]